MRELLKQFPRITFHKEEKTNNISFNNDGIFMAIPKGEKFFLWFTKYKGDPICILVNKRNRKTEKILCSFDITLSLGTIICGTKFMLKNQLFFTMEDIFYFKGKQIYDNFKIKKKYLNDVLMSIHNDSTFIIFGFPVYNVNYKILINMIKNIYYPIYSIQYRNLIKDMPYLTKQIKQEKKEKRAIFSISPDLRQDIYRLNCKNNEFYSYAHIPNLKTSIFMNDMFRKIKENKDIDLIEESEDENDFEITGETKYVKNIHIHIECKYSEKFKMWVPESVSKTKRLETKETIRKIELS